MRRPLIPPPLIGLMCAFVMWLVARYVPIWQLDFPMRRTLAGFLVLAGLSIDAVSVAAFFRSRTTVNPLAPERAERLVVSGLFQVSRNPMYLGMLLVLCGVAVWFAQPLNLIVVALFVGLLNSMQIAPEEAALERKFGQPYRDYCRQVRRWL